MNKTVCCDGCGRDTRNTDNLCSRCRTAGIVAFMNRNNNNHPSNKSFFYDGHCFQVKNTKRKTNLSQYY